MLLSWTDMELRAACHNCKAILHKSHLSTTTVFNLIISDAYHKFILVKKVTTITTKQWGLNTILYKRNTAGKFFVKQRKKWLTNLLSNRVARWRAWFREIVRNGDSFFSAFQIDLKCILSSLWKLNTWQHKRSLNKRLTADINFVEEELRRKWTYRIFYSNSDCKLLK